MNLEELESALEIVRDYCRNYRGGHEEEFAEIAELLTELDGAVENTEVRTLVANNLYLEVVTRLVALADPPNRKTLTIVLNRIGESTDAGIHDVYLIARSDVAGTSDTPGGYSLRESLPDRIEHLPEDRELIDEFAEALTNPKNDRGPRDSGMRR
jgi:hypothetical protein